MSVIKSNCKEGSDLSEKLTTSTPKSSQKLESSKREIEFSTFLQKNPNIQPSIKSHFTFKPSILKPIKESELDAYLNSVRSPTSGEQSSKIKVSANFFSPRNVHTSKTTKLSHEKNNSMSNNNSGIITTWISTSKDNQIDGKFLNQLKNLKDDNISKRGNSTSPSKIGEAKIKTYNESQSISLNNTFINLDRLLGALKKTKECWPTIDNDQISFTTNNK